MIFQNPRTALNPIRPVGLQIADVLLRHGLANRSTARAKAIEALEQVRIARPAERYDAYPFELSGGMCQRVVIAIAIACRPRLLIADEPTTGLDVTTQKAVMDLVVELTRARGMSTLLITHDLGLAAAYCDRVDGDGEGPGGGERHRRRGLPRAVAPLHAPADARHAPPRRHAARACCRRMRRYRSAPVPDSRSGEALLEVEGLVKEYPRARGSSRLFQRGAAPLPPFRAVDGISFTVRRGESVGLVGESGCGKSTTSMMVMRLLDPTSGSIRFAGKDIAAIPARAKVSPAVRFAAASRWCSRIRPTA